MALKTARLTVLIDPASKKTFEDFCRGQDMTPSQVVRRMIRDYMEHQDARQRLALVPRPATAGRRER